LRGSIKSQLGYIWKQIDGIGISKREARNNSDIKNIDGNRQISGLVHSFEYKDEIFKTGNQLGEFAKENFGIKDFEKIDGSVIEKFIEEKIAQGVSKGTLDNYISHLSKIQIGLERIANSNNKEYKAFTKDNLVSVKEIVRDLTPTQYVNRAYNNPNAVISNLLDIKEYVSAKLQLDYGLRITEATFIKENQLNGNILTFQGKGGYTLQKELSQEIANQIKNYMENGVFKVDQNHFRNSLKDSCRIEGEKYTGAHGLRYNFAQNTFIGRLERNIANGMNVDNAEKEALKYTSEQMGHHREEITKHYLG
jgi:integrase